MRPKAATISCAVMVSHVPTWSGIQPMRARAAGPSVAGSAPSTSTLPESGANNPASTSSRVVLPLPLGPIRPVITPGATSTSACSMATFPSNSLRTSRA
ncbi:hypothetical protein WU86_09235 [Corynebacterium xerosis]|nr:hypothetical protein WU86_09235 [Corynebacterium xerosis]